MRLKSLVCVAVVMGSAAVGYAADPAGSAKFAVSESTKVPGLTLQPGTYSIRVVDHLADRLIVRVDDPNGSVHSTFIGIQNRGIPKPSAPGAVSWSSPADGTTALRGFEFPGNGPVVEFVYPKAEAVAIAKTNSSKVAAIDPASEGKVSDPSLSKDDMEVVTLWMLSSTQVGPGDAAPSIKAERYQQVASAKPPKPVVSALPHTGSEMPLVWLVGAFSLAGAGVLRIRRAALQQQ